MTDHEWTRWRPHGGKCVPAELKVGMMIERAAALSGVKHLEKVQ